MNKTERIIIDEIVARENSVHNMRIISDISETVENLSDIYQDKELRHIMRDIRTQMINKIKELETSNNKYWTTLMKGETE